MTPSQADKVLAQLDAIRRTVRMCDTFAGIAAGYAVGRILADLVLACLAYR